MAALDSATVAALVLFFGASLHAEVGPQDWRAYELLATQSQHILGGRADPIWAPSGDKFVYLHEGHGQRGFFVVDLEAESRAPFFDTARLAQSLRKQRLLDPDEGEITDLDLPFRTFRFEGSETLIRIDLDKRIFFLDLETYALREADGSYYARERQLTPRSFAKTFPRTAPPDIKEIVSPDRKSALSSGEFDLLLRDLETDRSKMITQDGVGDDGWWILEGDTVPAPVWSPDSEVIFAVRGDNRQTNTIPVVDWLSDEEHVARHVYPLPGGPITRHSVHFIDVATGAKTSVNWDGGEKYLRPVGWTDDSQEFWFLSLSRFGDEIELVAAARASRDARVLWREKSETFVVSAMEFSAFASKPQIRMLSDRRFIITSEKDGFPQLYLYEPSQKPDGPHQLTRKLTGERYPVVAITDVDETNEAVYFMAHPDAARPYDQHLMRVTLDGEDLRQLTEATGWHEATLSPHRDYFIATHSTVSRPAETELRRVSGERVMSLSQADAGALTGIGWTPPEEFVVKAADGETDLHGIIRKPWDFDAAKSYPVVEYIYGGAQVAITPRVFGKPPVLGNHMEFSEALAQLGFVVVTLDARGTPGRGKAFQDVVFENWGRHEIADHAAALRALAAERPYMDLGRVGIMGSSYGGYFATRALLQEPELYAVGVASAPATNMATINAYSIENYMGGGPAESPEAYAYADNVALAETLRSKLLIMHPTSDVNAPLSQSMKLIDALIEADKRFDVLIMPMGNHHYMYDTSTERHLVWRDTVRDYFLEHLEP